ncbi:MAG: UDP-N-acetylmuramoyl-L-alanyl-D-glutamate--2,6-diaminopimelate ligase, partial [Pararhodobacter sp.]|nr:UDP-N-acetylmuramoyl-L-alanyl-D-glutamate--2,6-diaminopimelate ligase [Pararhodobacter sp.]
MSKAKSLGDLGLTARSGNAQARITAITLDSRQVRPGTLFAALPGSRMHGAD